MANLESDVMRSFALVIEVIKDQVMSEIQSNALRKRVLADGMSTSDNLKSLDSIIKSAIDQSGRNSMRQMQSSLRPYVKEIERLKIDSKK